MIVRLTQFRPAGAVPFEFTWLRSSFSMMPSFRPAALAAMGSGWTADVSGVHGQCEEM
jgi:hypothetical protein